MYFKPGILMFLLELADCNKIVQVIANPLFSERKPVTFYKVPLKLRFKVMLSFKFLARCFAGWVHLGFSGISGQC